jgi:hypothetical protein
MKLLEEDGKNRPRCRPTWPVCASMSRGQSHRSRNGILLRRITGAGSSGPGASAVHQPLSDCNAVRLLKVAAPRSATQGHRGAGTDSSRRKED